MGQIISVTDLAGRLGRPIEADSVQETAAESIIDGLEGDLEAFLGRPLVPTAVVEEEVRVDVAGHVFVKKTPVVEVTAFTYGGAAIPNYAVQSYGLSGVGVIAIPPTIAGPVEYPLLSYTGGLPGDVPTSAFGRKARSVLLRAAVREFNQAIRQDLAGVTQASVEGTTLTFVGEGLTEGEKESVRRWKRRRARR